MDHLLFVAAADGVSLGCAHSPAITPGNGGRLSSGSTTDELMLRVWSFEFAAVGEGVVTTGFVGPHPDASAVASTNAAAAMGITLMRFCSDIYVLSLRS